LRVGDLIHILGHTTDFSRRVETSKVNHAPVTEGFRRTGANMKSSTKCRPDKRKTLDFRFVRQREI
jgi:hypothetical protein